MMLKPNEKFEGNQTESNQDAQITAERRRAISEQNIPVKLVTPFVPLNREHDGEIDLVQLNPPEISPGPENSSNSQVNDQTDPTSIPGLQPDPNPTQGFQNDTEEIDPAPLQTQTQQSHGDAGPIQTEISQQNPTEVVLVTDTQENLQEKSFSSEAEHQKILGREDPNPT